MKCSCCFAFSLKTVASICEYLLHYSLLHLHDHWVTFGILHIICSLHPACGHACGHISVYLVCLSKSSALSKMGRLWALTFTLVILMTSEFCQRGATVDTPFLTDLKTQTSPIECLVMLHGVLVQKFQSCGRQPCLRPSAPSSVPCLGLRTRLDVLCFFSWGERAVQ